MVRISKPPGVQRQEILNTAMELFTEKGHEDTSMTDITRRIGVMQGLCYRYFDSERVLFQEAMEQYVRECCATGLPTIHGRSHMIRQRLDDMAALTPETEQNARYHTLYHRPENQSIHEELNWRICVYLTPHVAEGLEDACQQGEPRLEHPALTTSYLFHGQIGLLGEYTVPLEKRVTLLRRCADRILEPEHRIAPPKCGGACRRQKIFIQVNKVQ